MAREMQTGRCLGAFSGKVARELLYLCICCQGIGPLEEVQASDPPSIDRDCGALEDGIAVCSTKSCASNRLGAHATRHSGSMRSFEA